jgi:hypothetical protein
VASRYLLLYTVILTVHFPNVSCPTSAFVVPLLDGASGLALAGLAVRAAGRDDPSIHMMTNALVAISTSLFISVNLGSLATNTTTALLLALTVLMNWKDMLLLYLAHRAGNFESSTSAFAQLMLGQTMELILPISYLLCFLASFYGPNAGVLGNVGNSYWHYQAVTDVGHGTIGIMVLVLVDLVSLMITAAASYWLAGFNVFKMLGYLQKEYGMMMSISQGYLIIHNFCVIIVACALDLTFKFNWVLKEGTGEI